MSTYVPEGGEQEQVYDSPMLLSSSAAVYVRPLRGRLMRSAYPRVTLAALAHPRLSIIRPLRGRLTAGRLSAGYARRAGDLAGNLAATVGATLVVARFGDIS